MQIQTVGIVGAGTMGNGIAQACAVAGLKAVMVDISEAAVAKGLATLSKSLDRLVSKDKISEADKAAALARVKGSTQYDDLKAADLVIEAATENEGLKRKILAQLDALLPAEAIIATNTSSISITEIDWRNPHVYFALSVTEPNGTKREQRIEAGPASNMVTAGMTADSLKVGDKVVTSAGILRIVTSVRDEVVTVRSADSKLDVQKSSVVQILERAA